MRPFRIAVRSLPENEEDPVQIENMSVIVQAETREVAQEYVRELMRAIQQIISPDAETEEEAAAYEKLWEEDAQWSAEKIEDVTNLLSYFHSDTKICTGDDKPVRIEIHKGVKNTLYFG